MPPNRNPTTFDVSNLPRGVVILAFWLLIALLFLWTGIYTVPPESVGVVQRFGAYSKTVEAGLQFKIPYGVDSVQLVPVRRQQKMEFGFKSGVAVTNRFQESQQPELERAMVTGDLNAALVSWVVQYRVSDPRQFLFAVADPEETMRAAAEAVMREVVGDRTVDEVITIGRQEIETETQLRLQRVALAYKLGLSIDHVQLKDVNPPREVQASFDEVNQAQQERERLINVANGEYNKAVPRARGEAARKISEAQGVALQRVNEAEGDAQRFTAVFTEYQRAPEVTRQRLYLETMGKVLPQIGRKIIVDEKSQQVLPLFQLDK